MTEQELHIIKIINELAIFMAKNSANVEESRSIQHAIDIFSNQLVMAVGRRTIKESKK